jgi:hypothetical protein
VVCVLTPRAVGQSHTQASMPVVTAASKRLIQDEKCADAA